MAPTQGKRSGLCCLRLRTAASIVLSSEADRTQAGLGLPHTGLPSAQHEEEAQPGLA